MYVCRACVYVCCIHECACVRVHVCVCMYLQDYGSEIDDGPFENGEDDHVPAPPQQPVTRSSAGADTHDTGYEAAGGGTWLPCVCVCVCVCV